MKIAIITSHFRPESRVAAIRVSAWADLLAESGNQVQVFVRYGGGFERQPVCDSQGRGRVIVHHLESADLSPSPAIIPSRFGARIVGVLKDTLSAICVPDSSVLAWRRHVGRLASGLRQFGPDVVISTSPPHGIHRGIWGAIRGLNIPWVVDFRDPYTIDQRFIGRPIQRLLLPLHRRAERRMLARAALVTCAIPTHARWLTRFGLVPSTRVVAIPNGVRAEFATYADSALVRQDCIRTVGTILDRDADQLARVVADCEPLRGFRLEFIGSKPLISAATWEACRDRTVLTGYLAHSEALNRIATAGLLVAFLGRESVRNVQLTSKLLEFCASGRPLVVINPTRSDRRMLRAVPWAVVISSPTRGELGDALQLALAMPVPSPVDLANFRASYSRRSQVDSLERKLHALVSPNRRGRGQAL